MAIDQHGDAQLEGVSIRSLPKVSLHDHLDGALRPQTIISRTMRPERMMVIVEASA